MVELERRCPIQPAHESFHERAGARRKTVDSSPQEGLDRCVRLERVDRFVRVHYE